VRRDVQPQRDGDAAPQRIVEEIVMGRRDRPRRSLMECLREMPRQKKILFSFIFVLVYLRGQVHAVA